MKCPKKCDAKSSKRENRGIIKVGKDFKIIKDGSLAFHLLIFPSGFGNSGVL